MERAENELACFCLDIDSLLKDDQTLSKFIEANQKSSFYGFLKNTKQSASQKEMWLAIFPIRITLSRPYDSKMKEDGHFFSALLDVPLLSIASNPKLRFLVFSSEHNEPKNKPSYTHEDLKKGILASACVFNHYNNYPVDMEWMLGLECDPFISARNTTAQTLVSHEFMWKHFLTVIGGETIHSLDLSRYKKTIDSIRDGTLGGFTIGLSDGSSDTLFTMDKKTEQAAFLKGLIVAHEEARSKKWPSSRQTTPNCFQEGSESVRFSKRKVLSSWDSLLDDHHLDRDRLGNEGIPDRVLVSTQLMDREKSHNVLCEAKTDVLSSKVAFIDVMIGIYIPL